MRISDKTKKKKNSANCYIITGHRPLNEASI